MIFNVLSVMTLILAFLLGIYVYVSDKKSKVNSTFVLLLLSSMLWIFCNFMADISTDIFSIALWSKATLVGPILIGYFFYRLALFFPRVRNRNRFLETGITVALCLLLIFVPTQLNIVRVYFLSDQTPAISPGPLYVFFLIYFVVLVLLAFKNLFKDYDIFNQLEKLQVQYITLGFTIAAVLGSIADIILPLFGNSNFVNYGPYFILVFVFFTSYAIIKFRMFNIKIIATQLLIFSLWIFVLLRTLLADNNYDRFINGGLLLLLLIFGWFLIRSVIKEVTQREKIESLAKQLDSLVHLVSHEVKGALGRNRDVFAAILEGDIGDVSEPMKKMVSTVNDSTRDTVEMVMDILNSSNAKNGTMAMYKKPFDMKAATEEVVAALTPEAQTKGLILKFDAPEGVDYMVNGDREKIVQHVIRNLIDNSIRYTPSGSVTVSLSGGIKKDDIKEVNEKKSAKVLLSIKDTGVGITPEDMSHLFTEGGRGRDSVKVNVHSTGYGLFFAKSIIDMHGGRIWAESAGAGKGSQFYVELPAVGWGAELTS